MADIGIYDPPEPQELWLLHDPVSGSEVVITPRANRDRIKAAVDDGAVILHQKTDGSKTVASFDDLPQPEEPVPLVFVVPEYVNSRVSVLESALNAIINALQGFLPQIRITNLQGTMRRIDAVIQSGNVDDMNQTAADLGSVEGPSME